MSKNIPTKKLAEKKKRAGDIQKILDKMFPNVTTALNFKNPFELLIATMLSAQCTDTLVNKITAELFKKYKSPKDFALANIEQLKRDIYPITFYNNKTKAIKEASKILIDKYNGKVPRKIENLISLPGVARKTANVVLGHAYGIASGIVVDTHVKRVTNRLGLTDNSEPKKIEQDLMQIIPKENWIKFSDQIIWFGRKICTARKNKCAETEMAKFCLPLQKNARKNK